MLKLTLRKKLTLNHTNEGWTNLHKWVKTIAKYFIIEQAIEDQTSLDTIKDKLYTKIHNEFLWTIPIILHNFFLDKGVDDIVEYWPRLGPPPKYSS
jgi:hypothetical protein